MDAEQTILSVLWKKDSSSLVFPRLSLSDSAGLQSAVFASVKQARSLLY